MAIPKAPEEEQQQVNEFKKSLESSTLEGFPDEVRKKKDIFIRLTDNVVKVLVQFLQANVWNMVTQ